MLGLCCCIGFLLWTAGLLSSCRVGFSLLELLLFQSMGFIVHGLQLWLLGSRAQAQQLRHTWVQLLCSMWDLPGSGIELLSPVLADGLLSIAPPGKPLAYFLTKVTITDAQPLRSTLPLCLSSIFFSLFLQDQNLLSLMLLVLIHCLLCVGSFYPLAGTALDFSNYLLVVLLLLLVPGQGV